MNFTPFSVGVPLSTALPVTQFAPGKITQNVATANGQVVGVLQGGENGVHYIRPLDANTFTTAAPAQQQQTQIITLPITMPGSKPGDPQQTVQIQIPIQTFSQGATVLTVAYNGANQDGIQIVDGQNGIPDGMTVVAALQPQDIQLIQAPQPEPDKQQQQQQQQQQQHQQQQQVKQEVSPVALTVKSENKEQTDQQTSVEASGSGNVTYIANNTQVQEYLQRIQTSTLPFNLQQFLKFNNDIKRENVNEDGSVVETVVEHIDEGQETLIMNEVEGDVEIEESQDGSDPGKGKKKRYKKKQPKPKKPKPGQVHIATALDGTTLFCCPECHMAYPEKELLEQHLVGHKIERRFICDICGAGLKRKEHLERHKLGHNPERPFVCSVCMKGFKRKEHLNLHFVIHSGEKTEICAECGKGFYRKDHLRKHTRSHITRRAKEAQAQVQNLLNKDGTPSAVTIQPVIPQSTASQIHTIPVQITVPQHHIQITTGNEEEAGQVSTVVLPTVSESISIMPH